MELAKFNGDVLKWHQFWDQFASNVDSRNINDVDKLLYLQSVLGGEAKQAIEGLDTTSKNYKVAIETLKERYGKPNVIIDAHYVALYRIPTAGNSVKECRNVFSEVESHLRVLKSLGEDVNHNHLRVMIMEKFPEDLIYELRVKLGSDEDSIENIRKNLEYIISARETSNRIKRKTEKDVGENITIETLHVKTENNSRKRFQGRRQYNVQNKTESFKKFDNKNFDRPFNKKRPYDNTKSTQYESSAPKKNKLVCIFCEKDHFNDECSTFKTIQDRKGKLKGRCFNCFGKGHKGSDCKAKRNCRHCDKYGIHNRALCPSIVPSLSHINTLHVNTSKSMTVLQTSTAHIHRVGDNSSYVNCRILLDCGSQRSYVTSKVAKELNLPVIEENQLTVFTFGAQTPKEIDSPLVAFDIVTRTNTRTTIHANIVPLITNRVPCPYDNIRNIEELIHDEDIILADDGSRDDQVDILIGNDYYYSFMANKRVKVDENLYLVKTDFGWMWSGQCLMTKHDKDHLSVLTYFQSSIDTMTPFYEPDLPLQTDNLKQLWDLESIGIVDSPKTTREEEAIKWFNETTEYIENRYYVQWPWTEYPPANLPVNFGLALGRLTNLLKRLDPVTIKQYDDVLKDQLSKGIIEEINDHSLHDDHPVHYLPHHCIKQEGKTTKLRIVYDASAKIKNYSSLNECLHKGPLLLEELTGLLIRFREHKIGIVADVEKAFLQIGLQQNDRDVTRFLWLKDLSKEATSNNLLHLRFCRVPFGVISSPFLLNATLRFHLIKSDSTINKQIAEDIYVDNVVSGSCTTEQALTLYKTVKDTFKDLSMNLCQWNSNSKEFVDQIPIDDRDHNEVIKILGIEWNTSTDELRLKPNYGSATNINTKRGVLKVTAAIYDPCGFIAPIILPAKLLLQELWKQKLHWDETLPEKISKKWKTIQTTFNCINDIHIPRPLIDTVANKNDDKMVYELHCFADASMQAYAAVVYLRVYSNSKRKADTTFVMGKSRVAPIKDQKELQIPRLELLGAVIGNRLIQYVAKFLRLHIENRFLWVDSKIVLSWFNSDKLLPPFIARRIKELKQNKTLHMRYVPGELNPADGATRPINAEVNNKYWLTGPKFLTLSTEKWPKLFKNDHNIDQVQVQTSSLNGEYSKNTNIDTQLQENNQSSNITDNNKEKTTEKINVVADEDVEETTEEDVEMREPNNNLKNEETAKSVEIIKLQKEYFPKETQGCKTDLSRSLDLFKDDKGILRCGGRFGNANWSDDKKNPILLPKNSKFTDKIIEDIHKNNYHVGVGHTLATVRNKYWILQGRSQVQRVLRNCMQCRKYGGGPYKMPLMPPLPAERVRYSVPFTFTGLDYFGPLKIQEDIAEKRWVCLFTCLAVRAIHMEVIRDLSAEECLMAIRRFIAVRGLPQVITSDNATQFKLTSNVLTSEFCIKNKIAWRFIPELAPWFGGFYERLIGIVKNCLKRTIDKHLLNHSQLCTIIKEVEAVVNNRPLTTVGQEFEKILTPADFLKVGGPQLTDISETEFLDNATVTKDNLIQGWKRGQMILKEYINMFISQYLTSLRERRNTHKQSRVVVNKIPHIGDRVQIKNDKSRAFWKVGRISMVIKGSDGQIRVVKVTMPNGETLTRSIGHLYPLEFEDSEDDNADGVHITAKTDSETPTTPTIYRDTPTHDVSGLDISGRTYSTEQVDQNKTRTKREAAQRAREKVKQWTQQLISIIL
ncbi:uncharacterized protein LOC126369792 [Pectinophora gossypiella]|uniref:uncharacterized protein LOC126369792 n=1 Tax=Pectinophora gossypiella TaxID=13191 RepID=UPI00214E69C7|nr:uncharacterized protein LOC126369792 [Pectinophora gossypiella]